MRGSLVVVAFVMAMGFVFADGVSSDVSSLVTIDTRSMSSLTNVEGDTGVDTRTFTEDWSPVRKINTKKFNGTMIFIR